MSVDGEDTAAARPRVVITGVGVVNAEFSGDSRALGAWLAAPPAPASTAAGPVRLALHGTADPVFPVGHGAALSEAVAGARLLKLEGGGHELHPGHWDRIVEAIAGHTGSKRALDRR